MYLQVLQYTSETPFLPYSQYFVSVDVITVFVDRFLIIISLMYLWMCYVSNLLKVNIYWWYVLFF